MPKRVLPDRVSDKADKTIVVGRTSLEAPFTTKNHSPLEEISRP
jgi:hypothetical protein